VSLFTLLRPDHRKALTLSLSNPPVLLFPFVLDSRVARWLFNWDERIVAVPLFFASFPPQTLRFEITMTSRKPPRVVNLGRCHRASPFFYFAFFPYFLACFRVGLAAVFTYPAIPPPLFLAEALPSLPLGRRLFATFCTHCTGVPVHPVFTPPSHCEYPPPTFLQTGPPMMLAPVSHPAFFLLAPSCPSLFRTFVIFLSTVVIKVLFVRR